MPRDVGRERRHPLREGISRALRRAGTARDRHRSSASPSSHVAAAAQHALEIAEIFGHPLLAERLRRARRLRLLVLVIEARGDRMMDVVRLGDHVGDGELELVADSRPRAVGRAEMTLAEEEQDVRGLGDAQLAGDEIGRREGAVARALPCPRSAPRRPPRGRGRDRECRPPPAPAARTRRGRECRANTRDRRSSTLLPGARARIARAWMRRAADRRARR